MSHSIGWLSLAIALASLALAGYVVATRTPATAVSDGQSHLAERVLVLEERIHELSQPTTQAPILVPSPDLLDERVASMAETRDGHVEADTSDVSGDSDAPESDASAVKTQIDRAVEAKLKEMRFKEKNKKPTMKKFAALLELSQEQIAETELEVIRGQGEIIDALNVVSDDGTNYFEHVIEIAACGMAKVKPPISWGEWVKRVSSDSIPGSNETYAARVQKIKQSMRDRFRRVWTEEQYAEYESWGVDPFHITHIEGSPGDRLLERIKVRANELKSDAGQDR